jgi:hypothetical protein
MKNFIVPKNATTASSAAKKISRPFLLKNIGVSLQVCGFTALDTTVCNCSYKTDVWVAHQVSTCNKIIGELLLIECL